MRISYPYDVPLPNGYAATIQILRTASAMAAAGHAITLWTAPRAEPPEAVLSQLGLAPQEGLRLATIFPSRPRSHLLRTPVSRLRLRLASGWTDADVVVSRGETGFVLASALARWRRRPPFVYEVHRLLAAGGAETLLGRSLTSEEPLPRRFVPLRRAEARAMAAADGFIFLTDAVRDAACAEFGCDAPAVVAPSGEGCALRIGRVDAGGPRQAGNARHQGVNRAG